MPAHTAGIAYVRSLGQCGCYGPVQPFCIEVRITFVFLIKKQPQFAGFPLKTVTRYGTIASAFGATAGIFAVFFFGEVPRVRKDILMNIPVIGGYWERSIPPEDNPF
ncbi:hypothetical protein HCBG_08133 [Histoplasma capsulatum G186AR]|uniref:Uncharacterized protein n=1 Tax=Ajellomyces capsulatus (strain G186AR / H82 / ATCC MYA-2454 / RMSCC 2432) TaxID=447093 RepID=C0NXE1_AJECG|nr:uncharacterized protein HCBG_08133 [Histoplasma capsulatum G186AR]EEH04007.1 hypothetical protein HCBG_08133 [Histoplasma capsulatum G186AR]